MAMTRIIVQVPPVLKAKLDAKRKSGTSSSWFIRRLIEKHFEQERRKPAV